MTSPGLPHSWKITIFILHDIYKLYSYHTLSKIQVIETVTGAITFQKVHLKGEYTKGNTVSITYKHKNIVIAIHSSIYHDTLTEMKHQTVNLKKYEHSSRASPVIIAYGSEGRRSIIPLK